MSRCRCGIGSFYLLRTELLLHPSQELVLGNDHPLTDDDGRKALAVHDRIGVSSGDAQNGGNIVRIEGQRELLVRGVSSGHI